MKKALLYIPIFGLACWALDFPFMRRISAEQALKNPKLREKDLQTVKRVCANFRLSPTTIINFLEGTRFTKQKYAQQSGEYKHLLKPRAGGVAYVLNVMGDQIDYLVDVTIYYPAGVPTFIQFLKGEIPVVQVWFKTITIPENLKGRDHRTDMEFRENLQIFLNQIWRDKDKHLASLAQL